MKRELKINEPFEFEGKQCICVAGNNGCIGNCPFCGMIGDCNLPSEFGECCGAAREDHTDVHIEQIPIDLAKIENGRLQISEETVKTLVPGQYILPINLFKVNGKRYVEKMNCKVVRVINHHSRLRVVIIRTRNNKHIACYYKYATNPFEVLVKPNRLIWYTLFKECDMPYNEAKSGYRLLGKAGDIIKDLVKLQ